MDAGPLGGGRSRTGWITFAGAYLLVAGAMNAIWGLAAVTDREVLREGAGSCLPAESSAVCSPV